MARVMSLVFMTFMLVPVLAPNIGQAILLVAPWRAIFFVLAAYALAMLTWSWLRLPETLHPEYRRSLRWRPMASAMLDTVRERQSLGYTLAMTVTFAGLIAYISSIQQIMFEVFGAPKLIGLVFASIAAPMALASYANSRIVERFGLRRVGHVSALLLAVVTAIHAGDRLSGHETFVGVRRHAGADHGLLRLHLVQLRHPGDGAYGADRRHRLLRPGRDRHPRLGRASASPSARPMTGPRCRSCSASPAAPRRASRSSPRPSPSACSRRCAPIRTNRRRPGNRRRSRKIWSERLERTLTPALSRKRQG